MPQEMPKPIQEKNIAIIGSTGGNLYSQGGRQITALLHSAETEARRWGYRISRILYLTAEQSMDAIPDTAPVVLLAKGFGSNSDLTGTLAQINNRFRELCGQLAAEIRNGRIDALISISADPANVNREVFQAAEELGIPIAASGASSIGWMRKIGCNLIFATGTTGTSSEFRSINYIAALVRYWQRKTRVFTGMREILKDISFEFETWSLPYFLLLIILNSLSRYGFDFLNTIYGGLRGISPLIACLAVSIHLFRTPKLGIAVAVSIGALASYFQIGFLGGIAAGYLGVIVFHALLYGLAGRKMPGSAQSVIIYAVTVLPLAFLIRVVSDPLGRFSHLVALLPDWFAAKGWIWIGLIIGAGFWPAIEKGYYHRLLLPFILLEVAEKGTSYLGAFDLLCLVVPAIGASLATMLIVKNSDQVRSGLFENIIYGTNVESIYTITGSNKFARFGLYALCGLIGLFIMKFSLHSVGYLPVFLVPFLVENGMMLGFGILATIVLTAAFFSVVLVVQQRRSG